MYLKQNRQIKNSKKNLKPINSTAILVLENGTCFKGFGLGYEGTATGEVCFNTSITGYQEIISDPSYAEQIINFTFPHIGNVGTNNEDHESDQSWTKCVILNSEITYPSNYRSLKNLNQWLKKNKIVGITGLDTRSLTNFIRDKGAPKGTIAFSKNNNFNIKDFHPAGIKASSYNNILYGLPIEEVASIMVYRKDIFDALKLKIPNNLTDLFFCLNIGRSSTYKLSGSL